MFARSSTWIVIIDYWLRNSLSLNFYFMKKVTCNYDTHHLIFNDCSFKWGIFRTFCSLFSTCVSEENNGNMLVEVKLQKVIDQALSLCLGKGRTCFSERPPGLPSCHILTRLWENGLPFYLDRSQLLLSNGVPPAVLVTSHLCVLSAYSP